jgi:hypothetical protein
MGMCIFGVFWVVGLGSHAGGPVTAGSVKPGLAGGAQPIGEGQTLNGLSSEEVLRALRSGRSIRIVRWLRPVGGWSMVKATQVADPSRSPGPADRALLDGVT